MKGSPVLQPQRHRSRRTHRRRCTPKSKVESIQAAIPALGPNPDSTVLFSLREALQKAKDMSGKPENPRQEAGKSPNERVEEAKARVARLEGALQLLSVDSPDAEPIKVALETARGQCRVLSVGERRDSCLKFVERAKGRVLKQQIEVQAAQELLAKFESQVAQGLADLERLRAEARVTPVATARPEEEAGNNIEELAALRREVDQLRRERDVLLGKTNPSQSIGHVNARDPRLSFQSDGRSHRRSRCKAKMRRRAFHNRQLCVVRKRISMYGLRGVRLGEASNPGPGRAQRRRRVSSSSADTECDPTLLDDFARDLAADVTLRDSSPWSMIPVRSQAVIAGPRPPGTFFSGRFVFLQMVTSTMTHLSTPLGPLSRMRIPQQMIPSVKSLTPSQFCLKEFPRSLRAWGRWEIRQKLLSQSSRHQCRCSVPVPASTWDLYHWTLSMSRISFRGGLA